MLKYHRWFPEARYGMFIHWGLYSLLGRGEWCMYTNAIPPVEYNRLANCFIPRNFSPRSWVEQAVKAGMRYMVMTAKHHDGFCLFDSVQTNFTSVRKGARRDFVAEYITACREAGLKVGLYFSCKDWQFPAYFDGPLKNPDGWEKFIDYYHAQVHELCENYGRLDLLWFDGGDAPHFRGAYPHSSIAWRSADLESWIRRKQPGILINGRAGMHADFETPEKLAYPTAPPSDKLFETCDTLGDCWGFVPGDRCISVRELFLKLSSAAANAHNLLLNVSPDADGVIPKAQRNVLDQIGEWLSRNAEAFYNTRRRLPEWYEFVDRGVIVTREDNIAYLILKYYPADGIVSIWKLANRILKASLLNRRSQLKVACDSYGRTILSGLRPEWRDPIATVVKLELDGPPQAAVPENFFGSAGPMQTALQK